MNSNSSHITPETREKKKKKMLKRFESKTWTQ